MKLFRRDKNKSKKDLTSTRSVVFVETNKTIGKLKPLRTKSSFLRLLKRIFNKKKTVIVLFMITSTFLLISYFININQIQDGILVSPIAVNNSSNNTNEIERKLANELNNKNIKYKRLDTTRGSIFYIYLQNNQEVIIAGDKDIALQIAYLQFIYNRLTMEGKDFKRLDLRFEKPVITLK